MLCRGDDIGFDEEFEVLYPLSASGDGQELGEAYVLYVAKRSVDHRISEAVRHDDNISGMEIDWDAQKSVVSRRSNGVYRE